MYGAESWVTYRQHICLTERFHPYAPSLTCWQDFVTSVKALPRANITDLRRATHVTRMDDNRLPKAVLHGELCSGKRGRGAPCKHFKDSLTKSLSDAISTPYWGKHRLQTDRKSCSAVLLQYTTTDLNSDLNMRLNYVWTNKQVWIENDLSLLL